MPKLVSGGVRITPMKKDGTMALATGTDYHHDETEDLVEDLIEFAKEDKVGVAAYVPDMKKSKANTIGGGWKPSVIEKLSEEREATLLVSFRHGFPAPYLAFFDPDEKRTSSRPTAKKSKYARKD